MKTENKCLKFTGYIYLPSEIDMKDKMKVRNYLSKTMGRIEVFDKNNKKMMKKSKAFINMGDMLNIIMVEFKNRVQSRIKK